MPPGPPRSGARAHTCAGSDSSKSAGGSGISGCGGMGPSQDPLVSIGGWPFADTDFRFSRESLGLAGTWCRFRPFCPSSRSGEELSGRSCGRGDPWLLGRGAAGGAGSCGVRRPPNVTLCSFVEGGERENSSEGASISKDSEKAFSFCRLLRRSFFRSLRRFSFSRSLSQPSSFRAPGLASDAALSSSEGSLRRCLLRPDFFLGSSGECGTGMGLPLGLALDCLSRREERLNADPVSDVDLSRSGEHCVTLTMAGLDRDIYDTMGEDRVGYNGIRWDGMERNRVG